MYTSTEKKMRKIKMNNRMYSFCETTLSFSLACLYKLQRKPLLSHGCPLYHSHFLVSVPYQLSLSESIYMWNISALEGLFWFHLVRPLSSGSYLSGAKCKNVGPLCNMFYCIAIYADILNTVCHGSVSLMTWT